MEAESECDYDEYTCEVLVRNPVKEKWQNYPKTYEELDQIADIDDSNSSLGRRRVKRSMNRIIKLEKLL